MSTAISIKNVSKKYVIGKQKDGSLRGTLAGMFSGGKSDSEEFWALNDVSFDIQQGDVVGIIGKNGAGKSTLLKILSQITKPTTGSIEINGRVASLLEVGTGFHPELTGRENVYLNGTILGMTRKEVKAKFDEIVAFSGVEKFIDTPVKRYSSGMYVRLAFAVAAHLEPEILIIDEVLAVGDAEFQKKCLGKMKDVAGEGRTVIFVSHDLKAVKDLCQTTVLLEKGSVKAIGETSKIVEFYLENTFSKGLDLKTIDNGKLFFSDVKLNKSSFSYGDEIELFLKLENSRGVKYDNLNIIVNLYNKDSNKIVSLESRYLINALFVNSETKFYSFKFENKLKAGNYSAELVLFEDWKVINEINISDFIEVLPSHPYSFKSSNIFSGDFVPLAHFNI